MMRLLSIALLLLSSAQNPGPMLGGALSGPPACVAPTMTYRWTPTAGCSTSTVCATDQVAGNNASQTVSGDLPTYSGTGGPNSTPILTFNGTTDFITPTTAIANPAGGLTIYVIFNQTANPGNTALLGGATNAMEYGVDGSGNMFLNQQAIGGIGAGASTVSTGTWYTKAVTFNSTSNVWSFYNVSGGSQTVDAAGSTGYPTWASTPNLGGAPDVGQNFNGKIAEWGYLNSVNTTGIAFWSNCHYGV